jgi:hypothetical protein
MTSSNYGKYRDLSGHVVQVVVHKRGRRNGEGSSRAECSCGWQSRMVGFVGQAADLAGMHRLDVERERQAAERRPLAAEHRRGASLPDSEHTPQSASG